MVTEKEKTERLADTMRTLFLVALVALIGVFIISNFAGNGIESDTTLQSTSSKL